MSHTADDRSVLLGDVHLEALRSSIRREGIHSFAARSQASLGSVLRAASGCPIRKGTRSLIVAALEAHP